VNRVLPLLTFLILGAVLFLSLLPPGVEPTHSTSVSPARPDATPAAAAGGVASFLRNPFRFGDEDVKAAHSASLPRPHPSPVASVAGPPPTPVRLVGFLQGARGLEAVLSIEGEVVVGRAGTEVEGYTLLSVDLDLGVRLKDPTGRELVLPPAS
jgi:hypothetical protein